MIPISKPDIGPAEEAAVLEVLRSGMLAMGPKTRAFEEAWAGRVSLPLEGVAVPVIGREALIRNKRALGRPRDLADVAELEEGGP